MHWLLQTYPTPAANLAADEALVDWCDLHQEPVLRCWESPEPFVVLGYGNRLAEEVNLPACRARGIPVLRRCSGGGTVVQGPGCLSYALALPLDYDTRLTTISGANTFIMERQRSILAGLLPGIVAVAGHTDLAWNGRKFSGNAQRRKRRSLLFHGTLLCGFDLPLIAAVLQSPPRQPEYRRQRPHQEFVTNTGLVPTAVHAALRTAWGATEVFPQDLLPAMLPLVAEKYGQTLWNERI